MSDYRVSLCVAVREGDATPTSLGTATAPPFCIACATELMKNPRSLIPPGKLTPAALDDFVKDHFDAMLVHLRVLCAEKLLDEN